MNWHERYLQQARWTRDLRRYLFRQAGLDGRRAVLEVGCGTGAILADLQGRTGIHGLDLDQGHLAEAQRHVPAARLTCGDALELPFATATFGITFCHFLLLWVRDPLQVLREMKRVTCPGGAVLALAEPDHTQRRDEPAPLEKLGRWQTESLRRQGADPSLGGRLAALFHEAGLALCEAGALQWGEARSIPAADRQLEWDVLEADLAGSMPEAEILKMKKIDEEAWESGKRVLRVPTYFAHGVV